MGTIGMWMVKQIMAEGASEAGKALLDELRKIAPEGFVAKVQALIADLHAHVTTSPAWVGAPQDVHQFTSPDAPVAAPTSEG